VSAPEQGVFLCFLSTLFGCLAVPSGSWKIKAGVHAFFSSKIIVLILQFTMFHFKNLITMKRNVLFTLFFIATLWFGVSNVLAQNWNEIVKKTASDSPTWRTSVYYDGFPNDVDIDGEYAVATSNKAVTIYFNNAGTLTPIKRIVIPESDSYRLNASISGNYVVVGNPEANNTPNSSGTYEGAAYIYAKDQGGANNWGLVKKIVASDYNEHDNFGATISISGDYIFAGSESDTDAGGLNPLDGAGAVYIFAKDQGGTNNWGQMKKIVAADRASGAYFGESLSSSNNYLVVGAYGSKTDAAGLNPLEYAGAAYIFAKDQGGTNNWGQVKKIVASDRGIHNSFGLSVSISENMAIIGAYGNGDGVGAAYIFAKDQGGTNNWGEVKKIVAADGASEDGFGGSVSISGNYAIVGSDSRTDASGQLMTKYGAMYIFAKDKGGSNNWGQVKKIVQPLSDDAQYGFGSILSISGNNILTGMTSHIFTYAKDAGGTDNWGNVQDLEEQTLDENIYYGYSVAIDGNYAIVGAPNKDIEVDEYMYENRGCAYILKYNGATWQEIKKIVPTSDLKEK